MRRSLQRPCLVIAWLAFAFQALLPPGLMPAAPASGDWLTLCPSVYPEVFLGGGHAHHHHHPVPVAAERGPDCDFAVPGGAMALPVATAALPVFALRQDPAWHRGPDFLATPVLRPPSRAPPRLLT